MVIAELTVRSAHPVEVRGLKRAFGPREVLHGLDLTIGESEFVALVGKSGGGKTTLLRTLAGRELARRHRPAVLLVTDDVDEALVLADRVLVLRDGRIDEELVTRGLYKGRSDAGFERARAKLLTLLEVRENTSHE